MMFVVYHAVDTKLEKQFTLHKKFLVELQIDEYLTAETLVNILTFLLITLRAEYRRFIHETSPTLEL